MFIQLYNTNNEKLIIRINENEDRDLYVGNLELSTVSILNIVSFLNSCKFDTTISIYKTSDQILYRPIKIIKLINKYKLESIDSLPFDSYRRAHFQTSIITEILSMYLEEVLGFDYYVVDKKLFRLIDSSEVDSLSDEYKEVKTMKDGEYIKMIQLGLSLQNYYRSKYNNPQIMGNFSLIYSSSN